MGMDDSEQKPSKEEMLQREITNMKLSLETSKSEYEAEHTRISTFEGRAGFLITLAGALLVFSGQFFTQPKHNDYYALIMVLQFISVLSIIGSTFALIQVITTKTFVRVNHKAFVGEEYLEYPESDAIATHIQHYHMATDETAKAINKRAFWFRWGLWLLFVGLLLVTVTRFVSMYTGG